MFFMTFFFFVIPFVIIGFAISTSSTMKRTHQGHHNISNHLQTNGTTVYVPIYKIEQKFVPAHGQTQTSQFILSYMINNILYSEIVQYHEISHLQAGQIIPVTYSGDYAKAFMVNTHQYYGQAQQYVAPQPPHTHYDNRQVHNPQQYNQNQYEPNHHQAHEVNSHAQQSQNGTQKPVQQEHHPVPPSDEKVSQIDADKIMNEILANDPTHMQEVVVNKNNNNKQQQ